MGRNERISAQTDNGSVFLHASANAFTMISAVSETKETFVADLLVGSTGFVGQNLADAHDFDLGVHSKNVGDAFGKGWDLVVYSGVPSAMFLANNDPDSDLAIMRAARANINSIAAEKTVLVSTIAVYADSRGKSEEDEPAPEGLSAYGKNRLQLERWVREDHPDALIVRLPALYGKGLKKNFLFDLLHPAPAMLTKEKYEELAARNGLVRLGYADAGNGFCRLRPDADEAALASWFASNDFNSLAFTDSRSRFQFYDLGHLWDDVSGALAAGAKVLNIATPPVSAGELYRFLYGSPWRNELSKPPFDYDMRSVHSPLPDGAPGYRCSKEESLRGIAEFIREGGRP